MLSPRSAPGISRSSCCNFRPALRLSNLYLLQRFPRSRIRFLRCLRARDNSPSFHSSFSFRLAKDRATFRSRTEEKPVFYQPTSHRSYPIPTVIPSPNITLFYGANISTFRRANLSRYLGEACSSTVLTISRLIQPRHSSPFSMLHMLNGYLYIHAVLRANQHSNCVCIRDYIERYRSTPRLRDSSSSRGSLHLSAAAKFHRFHRKQRRDRERDREKDKKRKS